MRDDNSDAQAGLFVNPGGGCGGARIANRLSICITQHGPSQRSLLLYHTQSLTHSLSASRRLTVEPAARFAVRICASDVSSVQRR